MANPDRGLIESRRLVVRADGIALAVTRGAYAVMSILTAIRARDRRGLAVPLATLTWHPPPACPALSHVRVLVAAAGTSVGAGRVRCRVTPLGE
ncbi:hypothetical protein Rmf_16880 [Roseomonas fluvialis]|uniref:Uncharacterized protein n=1 Tax=Roseomonas fluvialis TaxID=1750527 RepID=A0ABN6NZB2_9PROT|nr:hypothetical protein Rmf_16880 [Roseomonas fluvialis]